MVALNQFRNPRASVADSALQHRKTPPDNNSFPTNRMRSLLRARYYDPHTAEFLSPDPLEYVDGMSLFRGYFVGVGVDPFGLLDGTVGAMAVCGTKCAAPATPVIVAGAVVGCKAVAVGAAGYGGYKVGRCYYEISPHKWCVTKVCDWIAPPHVPPPTDPRTDPRTDPKDKPGPDIPPPLPPDCDKDFNCDCWCVGYQGTFEGTPTNIGWMRKESCLAISNIQEVPGELPYEEICACGKGWWE